MSATRCVRSVQRHAVMATADRHRRSCETSSAAADVIKALPDQEVRVDASPAVATDIARVGGKLHIFFANFDGLVGGQNAVQTPQKGIRVSIPPRNRQSLVPAVPWRGRGIQGQRQNGELVFVRPRFRKARSSGSSETGDCLSWSSQRGTVPMSRTR